MRDKHADLLDTIRDEAKALSDDTRRKAASSILDDLR
jgi:hypothetical protein